MLAVKAGAVATPVASVFPVTVAVPANVPLAPLAGAVNVTGAPLTGLLPTSFTIACNAPGNALPMAIVWGVPPLVAMLVGVALAELSAAPFRVTFPPPEFIFQVTERVWPATAPW